MSILKTKGIVLKEVNVGETDKIITILSDSKGKIQASVRGARRNKSYFNVPTQLFSYSDFTLYKGKNMYRVSQIELIESFYNIRDSLDKLCLGSYFAELTTKVIEENSPNQELLRLLLNTLYILSVTEKKLIFLKVVYEIRLLKIIGFQPNITECTKCGNNDGNFYFDSYIGGLVCQECIEKNSIKIVNGTIAAMKYILYSSDKKIFSFSVSDKVLKELNKISQDFISKQININFKTQKMLNAVLYD